MSKTEQILIYVSCLPESCGHCQACISPPYALLCHDLFECTSRFPNRCLLEGLLFSYGFCSQLLSCEDFSLSIVYKGTWGHLARTTDAGPSTPDHAKVCAQGLSPGSPSTARPSEARAGLTPPETSVHQSPSVFPTLLVNVYHASKLRHTWSSGPRSCSSGRLF